MPVKFNVPILLICFNRPDLTAKVLQRLSEIRPSRLYISIDGPRNKLDAEKITKIKQLIKSINWRCLIKTNFQSKNLGCKLGPVSAMDWFFKHEPYGIILEDDVLADKSFFYFAGELLKKYRNNDRIGSISGNNFQFGYKRSSDSYYFSRYSHSCGWATWRRVWNLYDIEINDYQSQSRFILSQVFGNWLDKLYWQLIFSGIKSGELDTAWDYQWNWMMWKNNMLGIIPNVNLVSNMGFGRSDATHTKFNSPFAGLKVSSIKFPLLHPKEIQPNIIADNFTQKHNYILWKELAMNLIRKIGHVKKSIVSGI